MESPTIPKLFQRNVPTLIAANYLKFCAVLLGELGDATGAIGRTLEMNIQRMLNGSILPYSQDGFRDIV